MKKNKLILYILAVLLVGTAFYFVRFEIYHDEIVSDEIETSEVSESSIVAEPLKAPVSDSEESDDLQTELTSVMNELPSKEDLQNLSEEDVHMTPEIVTEGGMKIGRLIDKADKDPVRREATLSFLKGCTENEEVIPQLRALCWNETQNQIQDWQIFIPISDAKVPEDIKSLSSKL